MYIRTHINTENNSNLFNCVRVCASLLFFLLFRLNRSLVFSCNRNDKQQFWFA